MLAVVSVALVITLCAWQSDAIILRARLRRAERRVKDLSTQLTQMGSRLFRRRNG